MAEHDRIDRIDRFENDIANLRLKTSGGMVERLSGILGVLMMAAGIGVAIGAALKAGNKEDPRDLDELIILCLAMITLVVTGAALFLQRSLTQFWRYWMLRQTYEHQRHLDLLFEVTEPESEQERNIVQLVSEQAPANAPDRQHA